MLHRSTQKTWKKKIKKLKNPYNQNKISYCWPPMPPPFLFTSGWLSNFLPEIHLIDEMHVGSGVESVGWGADRGMPGVHFTPQKWEAGDCSLWEHLFGGKWGGEEKGGRKEWLKKRNPSSFLCVAVNYVDGSQYGQHPSWFLLQLLNV